MSAGVKIEDFYSIESLGVDCTTCCGGCKYGRSPLGAKNYSLKEERELELIERNLEFDNVEHRWVTQYPWIKDPADLPDTRRAAFGMLISTEKKTFQKRRSRLSVSRANTRHGGQGRCLKAHNK